MPIKIVVAVTDRGWFEHLRKMPDPQEVNFWAPSGTNFQALAPGELFLFKLHAPENFVVGGGIFAYSNTLPCSLAWQAFGEANGARDLAEMRARIARLRHKPPDDRTDFVIGNRILTQPFFLDENRWFAPPNWARNIVTFKTYSSDESDGRSLWENVESWLDSRPLGPGIAEPRYGEPTLIRPRLGQGAFRILVTDIYNRRCTVTGERTLPALEAAHIQPYAEGGLHEARNGLLLRRDLHSLFDAGYVTVTPEYRFEVSRRIRDEFENGRDYYALHGRRITVPDPVDRRPDGHFLAWHNEHRFFG
jgi:HNH endonuclease